MTEVLLPCPFCQRELVLLNPATAFVCHPWKVDCILSDRFSFYADAESTAAWNHRTAGQAELWRALAYYADQLCEGWCEDAAEFAHFEDCGGCLAKRVCAKAALAPLSQSKGD